MSALERRDRELELEMQDIEINGSRDVNGNEVGQMRDTGDKQEPRSEWELMKQNIADAGYETETGTETLMIMKQKQAPV